MAPKKRKAFSAPFKKDEPKKEEAESHLSARKSPRLQTPVVPDKEIDDFELLGKTPDLVGSLDEKSSVHKPTTGRAKRSSKHAKSAATQPTVFKTPKVLQTPKTDCPCPVKDEVTPATKDFDSLADTPQVQEKVAETPTMEANGDFDYLAKTPADEVQKEKEGLPTSKEESQTDTTETTGRQKRARKQTTFFGEIEDSQKIGAVGTIHKEKDQDQEAELVIESESESGSDYDSESDDEEQPGNLSDVRKRRRTNYNVSHSHPSFTMPHNVASLEEQPLEIHQVCYHPSLARHRGWGTDGVRAWVNPHPLPLKIGAVFTDNEIQASRNFSPGPPVCPWLVRTTCHGRFPMDEVSVRIALQMRVSYQACRQRDRRDVAGNIAKYSRLFCAVRRNFIPRTDRIKNLLVVNLVQLTHEIKIFTIKNCIDCLDDLAEINTASYWFAEGKQYVLALFDKIQKKVQQDFDNHRFSPLFRQMFERYQLPYTGEGVLPRRSKTMVVTPGSGPPFLTRDEFKRKFREYPRTYTDEELTRTYDRIGNVTGHFTIPNLRELLMPLDGRIEGEVAKEDTKRMEIRAKMFAKIRTRVRARLRRLARSRSRCRPSMDNDQDHEPPTGDVGVNIPKQEPNPGDAGVKISKQEPNPGDVGVKIPQQETNPDEVGVEIPSEETNPGDVGVKISKEETNPGDVGVKISKVETNPDDAGVKIPTEETNPGEVGVEIPSEETNPDEVGVKIPKQEPNPGDVGVKIPKQETNPGDVGVIKETNPVDVKILSQETNTGVNLLSEM